MIETISTQNDKEMVHAINKNYFVNILYTLLSYLSLYNKSNMKKKSNKLVELNQNKF